MSWFSTPGALPYRLFFVNPKDMELGPKKLPTICRVPLRDASGV
jgi:hypothetical protein